MLEDLTGHVRAGALPTQKAKGTAQLNTHTQPADTTWARGEQWGRRCPLTRGNQECPMHRHILMGLPDPPGGDGERMPVGGKTRSSRRLEGSVNVADVGECDCDCYEMERQMRECSQRDSRSRQGWRESSWGALRVTGKSFLKFCH